MIEGHRSWRDGRRHGLRDFLRTYVPDFCWVTAKDIMLMLEQTDEFEDTSMESLRVTLLHLKKEGTLTARRCARPTWAMEGYRYRAKQGNFVFFEYLRVNPVEQRAAPC